MAGRAVSGHVSPMWLLALVSLVGPTFIKLGRTTAADSGEVFQTVRTTAADSGEVFSDVVGWGFGGGERLSSGSDRDGAVSGVRFARIS